MKVFPKEADYAVRTLIFLALREGSEFVSVTSLAGELGLPLYFLRRICSALAKAGLLEVKEGAGGGVRLDRAPEDVNLLEITALFRDRLELSDCTFRKKLCPNRGTCPLRKRILAIEDKVKQEFEAVTLRELIDDVSGEN